MDDDEWEEMDVRLLSEIHLNFSDEVIHNVIDEEKQRQFEKLESVYGKII
jgi:hypothetical protein